MVIFGNVAKCTKCEDYVETSNIANIEENSSNYTCLSCEGNSKN